MKMEVEMSDGTASETEGDSGVSGDDDIVEDLEESGIKRKHDETIDLESENKTIDGKKRRKLQKENLLKKLHKPPTADELNRLKETENLFHSNLFRLQVEEMLKEIQLKPKYAKKFEAWFEKFQSWLLKMEDSEDKYELSDKSWLKDKKVKLPITVPAKIKGSYQFKKPSKVKVIGSFQHGYYVGPKVTVDVLVEMPQDFFHKDDYLNMRYQLKRALYLCEIAYHLSGVGHLVSDLHFIADEVSSWTPLLEVTPSGGLEKYVSILLRPVPQPGTFKLNRFLPRKNNVRPGWLFDENDSTTEGNTYPSTPFYNSSVLSDIRADEDDMFVASLLASHASLREGIVLLKVWLRQRDLEREVNGFTLCMLLSYLLRARRLSVHMSSYQVLRIFCSFLETPDMKAGMSLCNLSPDSDENLPSVHDFTPHYPLILLDPSGYHNVLGTMSKSILDRLQHEATLALRCLDTPNLNSFHLLFMSPVPFYRHYDHLILFHNRDNLEALVDTHVARSEQLSYCNVKYPKFRELIHKLLERGFGERVLNLHVKQVARSRWKVKSKPHQVDTLVLGVNLDPERCLSVVDKASGEGMNAAEEFRELWGARSELRRFQDGTITEAVVWQAPTLADKRLITKQIAMYLLKTKLGICEPEVIYVADELNFVTRDCDEETLKVLEAFDSLSKVLRDIKGLPLDIVSVQGVSPLFRYSDPCPPRQIESWLWKGKEKCPPWLGPVDAVVQLGPSNKWPRSAEAIRRIRAAFSIKIAELLTKEYRMTAKPLQNSFEVFKDGLVFRLSVFYPGEVALLKQSSDETGLVKYTDTEQSLALERAGVHLPKLSSALHGLHNRFSSFGSTCQLVKRWVSSHLMDPEHISEEALELLVACVYLRAEPQTPPCQPQTAFLRFLHLMASTNWNSDCIIINFNSEMNREEVLQIESHFNTNRANLPVMFIATPYDRTQSIWTIGRPTPLILLRLVQLCSSLLSTIENNILKSQLSCKSFLEPSLIHYDVILHLSSAFNPRRYFSKTTKATEVVKNNSKKFVGKLPIAGFDPVACFVSELRAAYDDFALFFYDYYGGNIVSVLWKPTSIHPRSFKSTQVDCRSWNDSTNLLEFNKDAVLADFCLLGKGLVKRYDVKIDGAFVEHYVDTT